MTTQPDTSTNKAVVVGRISTVLNRKRKATMLDTQRNALGGNEQRMAVHLLTPLNEPYQLEIEVNATTPGYDLLTSLEPNARIAIEGEMRMFLRYDARYAEDSDDAGRRINEMRLDVHAIRLPHEQEPDGATAVWLEGVVLEPPVITRHHEQPGMQVAITRLEVYVEREKIGGAGYPGLRRRMRERLEIPVAILTSDEQAGLLYRPGNRVKVDGELTRWIMEQGGQKVKATTDKVRQDHEANLTAAKSEEEKRAIVRQYRRQMRALTQQPRTIVLASFVESLSNENEALSLQDAIRMRREFSKELRNRRRKRQEQGAKKQKATIEAPAAEGTGAVAAAPADAVAVPEPPQPVPLVVPVRRRTSREATAQQGDELTNGVVGA